MVHVPDDKRLRVLEQLMVGTSVTHDVPQILCEALLRLLAEMPDRLEGAAYLLEGEAAVPVSPEGPDAIGGAAEALARLLQEWWDVEGERLRPRSPQLLDVLPERRVALMAAGDVRAAGGATVLLVPLNAVHGPLGYCALASPHEAPELDEHYWGAIGRALGLAVDNARLYQDVHQRLRRSQALYQVSRTLSSTLNLDRVLSLIVTSAVDTIEKAANGVLHLLDEETGELHPRALSFQPGVLPDTSGRGRMHLGQGVAGTSLQTGVLVNIPDVSVDPRFIHTRGERRFASMAVAPLLLGDRRIGTLSVDSDQANAFDKEDEQLLMTLATMAAAAIDNARLVTDLQESIDHLKRTQEQLIQSAKLSAVGQLISGVAHELNNPLTAVMGYTQLLQMMDGLDDGVRRDLEKVHAQARRAADIVENLLTFARQRKQEAEWVDVNDTLLRALELRAYQLRKARIDVVTNLEEGMLGIRVQPDRLQQVFLQLIGNAQDALREVQRDRRLVITTERDGAIARIRFRDNGPGLSPEAQAHLFEPFFTTKQVGEGTGLGLSICFGIVSEYEGRIYAESERGRGATFVVEFPLAGPGEPRAQRTPEECGEEGRLVVVVAPAREVADRVEGVLLQEGHRVVVARDAEDALVTIRQAHAGGRDVDAVVADLDLPGMPGPELYGTLRAISPPLTRRVIFVSGPERSPQVGRFVRDAGALCIGEPVDAEELTGALEAVLSSAMDDP